MNGQLTTYFTAVQVERDSLDRRAGRGWLAAQAAAGEVRPQGVDRLPRGVGRWLGRLVPHGRVGSPRPDVATSLLDHAPTRAS